MYLLLIYNCKRFGPVSLQMEKVLYILPDIEVKRLARSKPLFARFVSFVLMKLCTQMRNYLRSSGGTFVKTIGACTLLHLPYHKSFDASKEFSIRNQ